MFLLGKLGNSQNDFDYHSIKKSYKIHGVTSKWQIRYALKGHFYNFPDDHTRVRLRSKGGSGPTASTNKDDYLNANYVDGFRTPRAYIATQGPMQGTFNSFWRMVWEQNTRVIVMITHLFENGNVIRRKKNIEFNLQ